MAHRQPRDFRLDRPYGTDDDEYLSLPKIADYIEHHIDRDVHGEDMTGDICTICQAEFGTGTADEMDDKPPAFPNDSSSPIRILPCHHLFHTPCILSWIHSVAPTRNTCPVCRVKLFHLNVLSPTQAARVHEDEMQGFDRRWRPELYGRLLGYVDLLVSIQVRSRGGGGSGNFVSIPRAARMYWQCEDEEDVGLGMSSAILSSENIVLGPHWIESIAAARVLEHLEEDGAALRAWAGQVFWGMYAMMVTTIREIDVAARAGEIRDRIRAAHEAGEERVEVGDGMWVEVEGDEDAMRKELMEAMGWDAEVGEVDEVDDEDEEAYRELQRRFGTEEVDGAFRTRGRDRGDGDGEALFGAAVEVWDEDEDGGSGSEPEDDDGHMDDQTHGGSEDDPRPPHSRLAAITSPASPTSTPAQQPRLIVRLPLPHHLRRPPPPTITNTEDQDAMDIDNDDDTTPHPREDPAITSPEQDTSIQQPSAVADDSASSKNQSVDTPPVISAVEPIDDLVPMGRAKRKRKGVEVE